MNNVTTKLASFALLLAVGIWFAIPQEKSLKEKHAEFLKTIEPTGQVGNPDTPSPDERRQQEFMMMVDPSTGTVPYERVFEAVATAKALQKEGSLNGFAPTGAWSERGPTNVGGRTRGIMFDPNDGTNNTVFAGGVGGGIWMTSDITNPAIAWTQIVGTNAPISEFAFDPTSTMTFYAGTGEGFFNADAIQGMGLLKSTDGGTSWAALASTSGSDFTNVQDVVVTATGTVIACTRGGATAGVLRSTNGGTTWTSILSSPQDRCGDLEVDAAGDIYAGMGLFSDEGLWKSTDDGATFVQLGAHPASFRISVAAAPSDANVVYTFAQAAGANGIGSLNRSADAGATWTSLSLPVDCDAFTITAGDFTRNQAWYDQQIIVNPTDENDVIVGAIDMFRTTDADLGGTNTWQQISVWDPFFLGGGGGCPLNVDLVHADHHGIMYKPGSSTEVVMGNDGGVYYTADITVGAPTLPTIIDRNNAYNVTQYYSVGLHPDAGSNVNIGGTQDNGTQRLSAGGVGASTEVFGGDGGFAHIDQTNPNIAFTATTRNNLRWSNDGGNSFSDVFDCTVFGQCNSGSFINPTDYDDETNVLFANAGFSNAIIRVTGADPGPPAGALLAPDVNFTHILTALHASPYAPVGTSTLYVGTSAGDLYRSANAHNSATLANVQLNDPGVAGAISSINFGASEMQILLTYSNFGVASVWESMDGGTTWTDIEGNLPDVPVRWALYHPTQKERIIVATEAGVWETDDAGALALQLAPTWTPTAAPVTRIDMLQTRPSDDFVLAATHGRGMFEAAFEAPLPVELTSFNVVANESDLELAWTTASEENNSGFGVERALRELDGSLEFKSIGFVDGHGNTTEVQNYSLKVSDLESGTHVFRLKQLDFDGQFVYSDQIEASIDLPTQLAVDQVYPNPFSGQAKFAVRVQETSKVDVALFDLQGRKVADVFSGQVQAGFKLPLVLDGTKLTSGVYFVQAQTGEALVSQRINIVR